MRFLLFTASVSLGCVSTNVARLSPTKYGSRSSETPIPLYSAQLPSCAFEEIAIVKGRRETWIAPTSAVVEALRNKARKMGGDALVRVGFGDRSDVIGTVIRFQRDDCKH